MKRYRGIRAIIMAVLIVYAILSLAGAQKELTMSQNMCAELSQKVTEASTERQKLREKIKNFSSDETKISLAREKLGLVLPGEIIFVDED